MRLGIWVFVLLLVGTATLTLYFLIVGWTTKVTKGSHGPLEIGQIKEAVLSIAEESGWHITPIVFEDKYLTNASSAELLQTFPSDSGVMVWMGPAAGNPLRIEFDEDRIVRTWPNHADDRFVNSHEHIRRQNEAYARLQRQLRHGLSRNEAFDILGSFDTDLDWTASNFVVGEDYFSERGFRDSSVFDSAEYHQFLLTNDAWQFDGLKEVVPYFKLIRPFYSQVSLYFADGRLARIEHRHSPTELP